MKCELLIPTKCRACSNHRYLRLHKPPIIWLLFFFACNDCVVFVRCVHSIHDVNAKFIQKKVINYRNGVCSVWGGDVRYSCRRVCMPFRSCIWAVLYRIYAGNSNDKMLPVGTRLQNADQSKFILNVIDMNYNLQLIDSDLIDDFRRIVV